MSQIEIEPYLFFPGTCEEAIGFYRQAVGAEVEMMMRFRESPEPPPPGMVPEGWGDKVMHASFRIGGHRIMASDGSGEEARMGGFSLACTVQSVAEAERVFAALSKGGTVTMPVSKTFWSPGFGMLKDRFGVAWMVMAAAPERAGA